MSPALYQFAVLKGTEDAQEAREGLGLGSEIRRSLGRHHSLLQQRHQKTTLLRITRVKLLLERNESERDRGGG
jgi:hypothetical protein